MTPIPVKRIGTGPLNLAILTSVETRHRYFARAIAERFHVAAIVYARPTYVPAQVDDSELSETERAVVATHFAERTEQETAFFGHYAEFLEADKKRRVLQVGPGQLSTPEIVEALRSAGVDTIAVFGTDLIKPPLLAPQLWTMINLHLGLSPYYRGTATNFYPLLNEEPEYIGATIHLLDHGVDSGPILQHMRPEIVENDRPHSIGCKAIAAGIAGLIQVLTRLEQGGQITAVPQWKEPGAKVYFRKDYHPRDVVAMYRKWDQGLLRRILLEQRTGPKLVHRGVLGATGISAQSRRSDEAVPAG